MSGRSPRSSSASESPLYISGGKCEFLKAWTMCGYSRRIWSISRYFRLWMSCRWLCSMKFRSPSEAMYHVVGALMWPSASAYSCDLPHDVGRQDQARALAPQLAAAGGRADDPLHEVVEVVDVKEVLGGVDETQILGQEAARQGDPEPGLHRPGQLVILDAHLLVAIQGFGDVAQRRGLILDGFHQEGGLVVLDPLLDAGDDLGLTEVVGRDSERLVGDPPVRVVARAFLGPVVVLPRVDAVRGPQRLEQFLRFGDAVPAQVVDHAPGDAAHQMRVGLPQEVDDRPPLALLFRLEGVDRRLPIAAGRRAAAAASGSGRHAGQSCR